MSNSPASEQRPWVLPVDGLKASRKMAQTSQGPAHTRCCLMGASLSWLPQTSTEHLVSAMCPGNSVQVSLMQTCSQGTHSEGPPYNARGKEGEREASWESWGLTQGEMEQPGMGAYSVQNICHPPELPPQPAVWPAVPNARKVQLRLSKVTDLARVTQQPPGFEAGSE